jgi:hypothetical protein
MLEPIKSEDFGRLTDELSALLPTAASLFSSAKLLFDPDGGSSRNGLLMLVLEDKKTCTQIFSTSQSAGITADQIDGFAQDFARHLFVYATSQLIKYRDLADYFYAELKYNYKNALREDQGKYIFLHYNEIKIDLNSSLFSATTLHNRLIFVDDTDDFDPSQHTPEYSGNTVVFQKHNSSCFNYRHLQGMLYLNPTFVYSSQLYQQAFRSDLKNILDAINLLNPGQDIKPFNLKRQLASLETSNGKPLENLMERYLEYLFLDCFEKYQIWPQSPNAKRSRIRDFIINNLAPRDPIFQHLKDKGVDYILLDAKNYKDELQSTDLDTFFNYILDNKHFGGFGIILCRKGISENLNEILRDKMVNGSMQVIILDEFDLTRMIDLKSRGHPPTDVIDEKLSRLRLLA